MLSTPSVTTPGYTPSITPKSTQYTVVTRGPSPAPGQTYPPNWNWNKPPNWDDMRIAAGWDGTTSRALNFPDEQKNTLQFKNKENEDKTCPQPQDPNMPDISEKMGDILKAAGGDKQCQKFSELSGSSTSGSARAKMDAMLVSGEAEMKFQTSSVTDKKSQIGCGTLVVKTSNIISKQLAMQCIVNNCKSNLNVTSSTTASISIKTTPLSEDEKQYKAELNQQQLQQMTMLTTSDATILGNLISKGVSSSQIEIFKEFSNDRIKLLQEAQKQQLALYSRNIRIVKSQVIAQAGTTMSANVVLSTDAKNKLTSLSESISQDVAEMQVANTLGVNAQDPNVRNLVSQNSSKASSSASSSITNIEQNTNISLKTDGSIEISAPGEIEITDSVINANAVATIVVQQMMTQAISNGLDIASKALTDNKGVTKVLNEVKGLDDFQKALTDTIRAGTDASPGFGEGSGSFVKMALIGGAVLIVLVVVMNIIPKGGQSPILLAPQSRFRALGDIAHRLRYKMEPFDSVKKLSTGQQVGLGVVISLIIGAFIYVLAKK
jgi:hypothetical protein